MRSAIAVLVSLCVLGQVKGHGRLVDPPSRASMWRYGFNTPPDYNDNQGFCGGAEVQHTQNGGKCGICGDAFNAASKPHEVPGKYATGQIVKNYDVGETIKVKVEITANHQGYFVFKLCANNDVTKDPTQECFDETKLNFADGSDKYYIDKSNGIKEMQVVLPDDVECSQCILQWTYTAGNSWGVDDDGNGCLGCGNQETFRACSDISIGDDSEDDDSNNESTTTTIRPRSSTSMASTTKSRETKSSSTTITPRNNPSMAPTTKSRETKSTITTIAPGNNSCRATGVFKNIASYDSWCKNNCALGNCPSSHCTCDSDGGSNHVAIRQTQCRSYGVYKSQSHDIWCQTNCQLGNCPDSHCICD